MKIWNFDYEKVTGAFSSRVASQGGESLNAQEPLPNRLIKQQQEVDSYVSIAQV